MWIWVAALGLLLLGAQLYDWCLQATLPLWFSSLAGLGLAIASNWQRGQSPAPTPLSSPTPERESTAHESTADEPSNIPSISFKISPPASR